MENQSATRVLEAGYYDDGYAVVIWTTPDTEAPTAFVITLDGTGGPIRKINEIVEDGAARSCAFACRLNASSKWTVTVTPMRGEIPLAGSQPFAVPLRPLPPGVQSLSFYERQPYTPLLIATGYNVVKVRLLDADGRPIKDAPIGWSVPPEYPGVRLLPSQGTKTNGDGIATVRVFVPGGEKAPASLTVSAWRNDPASARHHVAAVFDCAEPRVFCSFVQNYAHPLMDEEGPINGSSAVPAEDQLISATATILDDEGTPIRGLAFSWRMDPNAATHAYVRGPDGALVPWPATLSPPYESGFRMSTDDRGQSTILFANSRPQIMEVSPSFNDTDVPYRVVFTAVDLGLGELPRLLLPLGGSGNRLSLSDFADTVPVTVPLQAGDGYNTAIWLNNDIVSIVYQGVSETPTNPIPVPSWRFITGNARNSAGYVRGQLSGNAEDSRLAYFQVDGAARMPEPQPGGTLDMPRFEQGPVSIVNDSTIAGGLRIRIPAYAGIAFGDRGALRIFIKAFYQNSAYEKFGFLTLPYEVGRGDHDGGFVIVVDQNDLTGYGLSPRGQPGTFVAQYSVEQSRLPQPAYSRLLTAQIVTTVPYKEQTWVALTADEDS